MAEKREKDRDEKSADEEAKQRPVDEAVEQSKNAKGPPRDERTGPQPTPGMGPAHKKRGKSKGPAPLPRDQIGGRG